MGPQQLLWVALVLLVVLQPTHAFTQGLPPSHVASCRWCSGSSRRAQRGPQLAVSSDSSTTPTSTATSGGARVPLQFGVGAASLPHPARAETGGEDAFFALPSDFGVFDGVGGFRKLGLDPAPFARAFAAAMAESIGAQRVAWEAANGNGSSGSTSSLAMGADANGSSGGGGGVASRSNGRGVNGAATAVATYKGVSLRRALEHALTTALTRTRGGGCTACVASLDAASGLLTGLNLGDSGLVVARRDLAGRLFVVYRTKPQQHRFNLPFQLGTNSTDTPDSAQQFFFLLKPDDIVIAATDGLYDNVFDEELVDTITHVLQQQQQPHHQQHHAGAPAAAASARPQQSSAAAIAAALAQRAAAAAADRQRETPWSRAASAEAARRRRRGGAGGGGGGGDLWRSFVRGLGVAIGELQPGTREYEAYGAPREAPPPPEAPAGGKLDDVTVVVACVAAADGSGGAGGVDSGGQW